MKNDKIIINEAYLEGLQRKYGADVDEIESFYGKVYPYGGLPGTNVDITKPFLLRLGGATFTEAQDVVGVLDATRSGVATRFNSTRGELYTLENGIKFLLADSEATENLSTLSADQFEYFMPKAV
jgi:hypothetical protein